MNEFFIKNINNCDEKELSNIGFDNSYNSIAVDKYKYRNIKIFGLSQPQAHILKQTAISVGADCAVHRELITGKLEKTDVILGGSFSQLKKIIQKLQKQPFNLKTLANLIEENLLAKLNPILLKDRNFDFKSPYIVGILNLTKNSFSDGGNYYDFEDAKKHLLELINDGADVIDIGAESTKPFSNPVSSNEQLEKLLPILDYIKDMNIKIPISIDTRNADVAEKCIQCGADIINDVSGLDFDEKMASVISKYNVPIVIQHSLGTPENMQVNPCYVNLIDDIYKNLKTKIDFAIENGIKKENIIVDIGIGFGKSREDNMKLLKNVEDFYSLACPIMVGISRKSFLNMPEVSNEQKDIFTLALNSSLIDKRVNFLRVHNVKLTKTLLELKL